MPTELKLTDIPPEDVDEVIRDFESEGCTATRTEQRDGNFTVTAQCPEGENA